MLTQSELKELLHYDPNTGEFRWKVSRGSVSKGTKTGTLTNRGYVVIKINNILYSAHRLAWLYMTGNWPLEFLDHIDKNKINNTFTNLRECTNAENQQNSTLRKDSISGYTGVSWHKRRNKWLAQIRINRKIIHIGWYDTPQEAHQAYLDAKAKYHTFNPIPR